MLGVPFWGGYGLISRRACPHGWGFRGGSNFAKNKVVLLIEQAFCWEVFPKFPFASFTHPQQKALLVCWWVGRGGVDFPYKADQGVVLGDPRKRPPARGLWAGLTGAAGSWLQQREAPSGSALASRWISLKGIDLI